MVDKAIVGNRLRKSDDMYKIIKQHRPDVIVFGYDQKSQSPKVRLWLSENRMKAKVVRIKSSLNPKLYKSSRIKSHLHK